MNESELESELRKLRPAAPSRALEDGIARELAGYACIAAPTQSSRAPVRSKSPGAPWFTLWLDRLLWSGLGAAAAMLALVIAQKPQNQNASLAQETQPSSSPAGRKLTASNSSVLQRVLASEEDLGWRDEGVRFDAHGRPMLKLSRTAVERQAWADLKNAGVVQMEQPRQEVLWVPVTVH
jgi:hypothetical protein